MLKLLESISGSILKACSCSWKDVDRFIMTAHEKPQSSYTLAREYDRTPLLHSKAWCLWWGKHSPMSTLWHHSTSQVYYGFLRCVGCTLHECDIMEFWGQYRYPYTLENHSTTITCICRWSTGPATKACILYVKIVFIETICCEENSSRWWLSWP